mgnify:FL=1|jgi:hypothetical protein
MTVTQAKSKTELEDWAQLDAWRRGWTTNTVAWLSSSQNKLEAEQALQRFNRVVQQHIGQIVANPHVKAVFVKRTAGQPLTTPEQELYDKSLWSEIYNGVPPSLSRQYHEDDVLQRVQRIFDERTR